jgi:hypothetical protein
MEHSVLVKEYINDLHLDIGEVNRSNCPVCGGKNTFTTTNVDGVILYNCYKAGCSAKGAQQTRLSVDSVMSRFSMRASDSVNSDEAYTMPAYVTKHSKVGAFADYWKIADTDLLYDVRDNRVVFPVYYNNKLVDAVGRTTNNSVIKWKRYNNSDKLFISGVHKNKAVVVEDVISASVVSTIKTSLTGVALMGTSLSDSHINQLKAFSQVVVALDPDARDKTIQITKRLLSQGINAKALNISDDIKYRRCTDVEQLTSEGD